MMVGWVVTLMTESEPFSQRREEFAVGKHPHPRQFMGVGRQADHHAWHFGMGLRK